MIILSVRNSLTEIYTEYNEKYGSQVARQAQQHTTSSSTTSRLSKAQNLIRDRTKRPRGSSSSNLELENYLTTTFDFSAADEDTFDILRWWAQKTQVYPILSLMAKEILACPVSTVAVEQAFSMGGNTLDERRSTIRPENLEHNVFLTIGRELPQEHKTKTRQMTTKTPRALLEQQLEEEKLVNVISQVNFFKK
ncbi:hypothetical protein F511_29947 [Dorcoceras hygrometricum]|uniref:HAT C-terminal dimerisation domain-containing protein n=1 Tax=Dorcoceras hygrometricum TaxID=472368 RepID=A0A2Z7D7C8_9LAMI|nr:hypothetical protein F511_29947 [Dorcoceras hygrometricum]